MSARPSFVNRVAASLLAPLLVAGLFVLYEPPALAVGELALVPETANYEIEARLDPDAHEITGRAVLRWVNPTREYAPDLCLHLYLNAFRSNRTTLMAAFPEEVERWADRFPDGWGGMEVSAIRVGGRDITGRLEFIRPDDGNPYDHTLARLPLRKPVPPNGRVEVTFDFAARLPRVFMRSGHADPFYFVAQWFPKIGVFQDGAWNCHQYHANSEFFADFGSYEVTLTVPSHFVVGHTGMARAERDNGDGTKTIEVHAEGVHDFAWAADPRFQVVEEQIGDVQVRLLLQPEHASQSRRYLGALRAAMERYARWFGPYPYPVLTVVDPSHGGMGAGGMEYPMLIAVGSAWWMPAGVRIPELLTVHEFGHQYWYGMVASDEVHDAWLDEGINSYVEGQIMDEVYGDQASYLDLLGIRLNAAAKDRLWYLMAGRYDAIVEPSHTMLDRGSYVSTTYAKAALMLRTLDHYLGEGRLRTALRAFFRDWQFRHPTGADWRAAIEASTGEDLDWFFEQVLDGTAVLDYAVARIDVREVPPLRSFDVEPDKDTVSSGEPAHYRAEVVVERRGDVHMPVEIVVSFQDGSVTREWWDGRDRWHRLEITGTQRAVSAMVDPAARVPLDVNRSNNSRMSSPGTRGIVRLAGRWGLWLQEALLAVTGF